MRQRSHLYLMFCSLLVVANADIDWSNMKACKSMRKQATNFAASCCQMTRPSFDKGNEACRKALKLPKRNNWTFIEQYMINACIEECNFINAGYADADPPFKLDLYNIEDNVRAILDTRNDSETQINFLMHAYKNCDLFRKKHLSHFVMHLPVVDFLEGQCNPYALQVTICVRIYGMQHCPKEYYAQTRACDNARDYFINCVHIIPK